MNYLNIHTDILKGEDFIGSEPTERATWLCILAWCATQENGGVIEDCEGWKDRQWQQLCGVTEAEVKTITKLYGFENGNLMVSHYPIESESAVKAKRKAGKKGGRPRKVNKPEETKELQGNKPDGLSELKRKGKEGNERERKEVSPDGSCPKTDGKDILAEIWKMAPPRSKTRSSKKQVLEAWKKATPKPKNYDEVLEAFKAWVKCDDWTKEDGQFAPSLHLWFKNRKWESLPEIAKKKTTHNHF